MRYLIPLLLLLFSCGKQATAPSTPSYPVQVAKAQQKDVPIYIEALGHVDPIVSIDIRSRIEGELTGISFAQGQEVKRDDLLFTIDPRPYEASLKQAKATLDQNLANLALAEEKVKRYSALVREEYYSQIDYETLQANYASNLALVQQSQAQVDTASLNLDYCWIYAPIDGLTGILQVDYGNLINNFQDTPLVKLNQMAPIFVTFSIPEVRLPDIQKYRRQGTLKTLAAYEDFTQEIFEGKLEILDNQVAPETGMIKLRGLFENTQRELWPGQFIRIRLILYTEHNAVLIPTTAIQLTLNGPVVFVVRENMTVDQRPIKLGQREDEYIIVLEGLAPGETIVTEGQFNLYPNVNVHVAKGSL